MRDYLRRAADDVWVIDCSPEGHQPEANTRVFQGVQQPVCIVLASRSKKSDPNVAATVRFQALPAGHREAKFAALEKLTLDGADWVECSADWRAPFRPASTGAWATYPPLEDLFAYNGSGVMPGRTWIIAPDAESLLQRWQTLIRSKPERKESLFVPHLRNGLPADKHTKKVVPKGLPGYDPRPKPIADERGECVPPERYGFRSFDRQWIIPDNRLINQPNPGLWAAYSEDQVYLTAPSDIAPRTGPALSFTCLVPDLHHYNGRGGRVFPLYRDSDANEPNIHPKLLTSLAKKYKTTVKAEDVMAYIAGIAAHPAYTSRFQNDLSQPGLRIPITAKPKLFAEVAELGRTIIWVHTFGERFIDPAKGRPARPPQLPKEKAPRYTAHGMIPTDPAPLPDTMSYDQSKKRLVVGGGYVENVPPEIWNYEVSGKQVLTQWFSYRKLNRAKPPMGDKRPPSELCKIQVDSWPAEYTTELLNVLHVLGRLVELEKPQAKLLAKVCASATISTEELQAGEALAAPDARRKSLTTDSTESPTLFPM